MLFSCIWFKNIWLIYVIRLESLVLRILLIVSVGHENRRHLMNDN